MRPPLVLCTRFGLGIKDRAWFEHRFEVLEAITVPSLASQTRQDFRWAVFVDADLDADLRARLEQAIAPVRGAVLNDRRAHTAGGVLALAGDLGAVVDGWALTGRIDDDDAWAPDTVEQVYARVDAWMAGPRQAGGLALTFPLGLEWLMYDMVDIDKLSADRRVVRPQSMRPYHYPFLALSVFVLAPVATKFAAVSASHSKMRDAASEQGLEVVEALPEREMWVYVRHKQALSSFNKSREAPRPVELQSLAERFGFDAGKTAAYIAAADAHGYLMEKRADDRRRVLKRRLAEIDAGGGDARERAAILEELDRLSKAVTGFLD